MTDDDDSRSAAAREEGYAAAVADVVAWLENKGRLLSEPPKTDARRNSASCLFIVAGQIQDGAHVGASKKEG